MSGWLEGPLTGVGRGGRVKRRDRLGKAGVMKRVTLSHS